MVSSLFFPFTCWLVEQFHSLLSLSLEPLQSGKEKRLSEATSFTWPGIKKGGSLSSRNYQGEERLSEATDWTCPSPFQSSFFASSPYGSQVFDPLLPFLVSLLLTFMPWATSWKTPYTVFPSVIEGGKEEDLKVKLFHYLNCKHVRWMRVNYWTRERLFFLSFFLSRTVNKGNRLDWMRSDWTSTTRSLIFLLIPIQQPSRKLGKAIPLPSPVLYLTTSSPQFSMNERLKQDKTH